MQNQNEEQYDEIDLMDYILVILRRKWLISAIFILAVLGAGVFSYLSPKIYEINTTLQIGNIAKEAIKNPEQVKEKISGDVYGIQARNNLNITEIEYPKLKVENPKNTYLIKILIESSDPQKSKNILEELNRLILEDHQKIINSEKKLIESQIKTTENKIEFSEVDAKRIENKIKYTEEEKENLEAKIEALQKTLVYQQDPGTQFALFNTKEELASKKYEIETLYISINSLNAQIENPKKEIASLEALLDEIEPTRVIREPSVSLFPIKPNMKLNIAIAGVLGLFLGIFLAFGKEFWDKNKKRV